MRHDSRHLDADGLILIDILYESNDISIKISATQHWIRELHINQEMRCARHVHVCMYVCRHVCTRFRAAINRSKRFMCRFWNLIDLYNFLYRVVCAPWLLSAYLLFSAPTRFSTLDLCVLRLSRSLRALLMLRLYNTFASISRRTVWQPN